MENNKAIISGKVASQMMFSHESHGEKFYLFNVAITRQSGTIDVLPVLVSEWLIDFTKNYQEKYIRIIGQFRSFNRPDAKLILSVFAMEVEFLETPANENEIFLEGYICKDPIHRETPFGRIITDLMIAVNRQCRRCDYIPCIAWGRLAIIASHFCTRSYVKITGRIQSREYVKEDETKIAYEVSVIKITDNVA